MTRREMPRLLLLCEYPTLNGGERSMLSVLDGVRRGGCEIVVACPPQGPLADALDRLAVARTPFCTHASSGRRLTLAELRDRLTAIVAAQQPDVVHANSLSMSRLAGPVTDRLNVPGLGHLRDIVRLSATAVADLNCLRRLVAVSEATRRFHVQAGLDPAKTHVVHNGVCLDQFQPRPGTGFLHRELALPPEARLVASIGQLGTRKGVDLVLQAARRLDSPGAELHYLMVGQRHSGKAEAIEYERQLRQLAQQAPLAGRVHFAGRREDVTAILNEVMLLVHAARQEPFGRVLLEAAASGVPVIATDVGGTRELFGAAGNVSLAAQHGCLLVPGDDPAALADAMQSVIATPGLARRLARSGRCWAVDHLDVHHTVTQLLGHYRELHNTNPPR